MLFGSYRAARSGVRLRPLFYEKCNTMEPSFETLAACNVLGAEDDAYSIDESDSGFHDLSMRRRIRLV